MSRDPAGFQYLHEYLKAPADARTVIPDSKMFVYSSVIGLWYLRYRVCSNKISPLISLIAFLKHKVNCKIRHFSGCNITTFDGQDLNGCSNYKYFMKIGWLAKFITQLNADIFTAYSKTIKRNVSEAAAVTLL